MARRFDAFLDAHAAALMRALALGDTGGLQVAKRDAWADAGLAHLLAISGLHVAWVARSTALMARPFGLWLGRRAGLLHAQRVEQGLGSCVTVMFTWLYAALAGLPVAAVRAALMISLAAIWQWQRRKKDSASALSCAGLIILWTSPLAAFDVGFLLSFASVGCLLTLGRQPHQRRSPLTSMSKVQTGLQAVFGEFKSGLATTIVTAPLCALFFGRLAWVGPLANLVAIPLCTVFLTPAALITCMLLMMPLDLRVLRLPIETTVSVMQRWAELCARLGGGAWTVVSPRPVELFACGLSFVVAGFRWHQRSFSSGLRVVAAIAMILWGCGSAERWVVRRGDGRFTVYHLDVGQGDATLLRFPDGRHVLVDGGGGTYASAPDPGRLAVAPALRALGVTHLDAVLITHPHPDHINGLFFVLKHWPCRTLWRSQQAQASAAVGRLEALVTVGGGSVGPPPKRLHMGGVQLSFFEAFPDGDASVNDQSIVLHLQFRQRSLVLLGDIESPAEAVLAPQLPPSDVMKVAHHGSRTSTSLRLLRAVRPHTAVISCARGNRFGFPHSEVKHRLASCGVTSLQTDLLGTVILRTDGSTWELDP